MGNCDVSLSHGSDQLKVGLLVKVADKISNLGPSAPQGRVLLK